MNIGLIARCDSTGLGIQSKGFFDHIKCKALVIDFSNMSPALSFNEILKPNLDWYPDQQVFHWGKTHSLRGDIPTDVINQFLNGLDIVVAMETPYDYNIFDICKQRGIKTVLQFNYEFLDFPSRLPAPDLFLSPSLWNYEKAPDHKKYLPVPVNANHFNPTRKEKTFVHIAGRPAIHDRNGTGLFLSALASVTKEINVVIKSQNGIHIPSLPKNINLTVDCGNIKNYFDNYTGGVLVLPRKYGGLCLVMNEAIAAGMPVITANISPNDKWLPQEWLVNAEYVKTFQSKRQIDVFETRHWELAKKIEEFCDNDFYEASYIKALEIRNSISWETLLPKYIETFKQLCD
jgi:glycosyltransferase involved in cell wall biosynthesis